MKKVLRFVLMISIITLFITACSNSYNEMIDGFNKKYFKKGYLPPEPYTTSSKDFKEGEMLDEIITMVEGERIVLVAPDGGEGCVYEWKGFIAGKEEPIFIKNLRTLIIDAPDNFDKANKGNKLVITVTESSGKQYTDIARVFIEIE